MGDVTLELNLSSIRDHSGQLVARDRATGKVLKVFEALGRGSQGPGNTQFIVNGNTPTGVYSVSRIEDTTAWNSASYGPNGALRLVPLSGNAAAAATVSGRKGLLIHGGSVGQPGYWRGGQQLRATHGCVRLHDESMKQLIDLLFTATMDAARPQCGDIDVTLTVTDHDQCFTRPR